jgi:hypothetical protein
LDHATCEGFVRPAQAAMFQVSTDPAELLDKLATVVIPELSPSTL